MCLPQIVPPYTLHFGTYGILGTIWEDPEVLESGGLNYWLRFPFGQGFFSRIYALGHFQLALVIIHNIPLKGENSRWWTSRPKLEGQFAARVALTKGPLAQILQISIPTTDNPYFRGHGLLKGKFEQRKNKALVDVYFRLFPSVPLNQEDLQSSVEMTEISSLLWIRHCLVNISPDGIPKYMEEGYIYI